MNTDIEELPSTSTVDWSHLNVMAPLSLPLSSETVYSSSPNESTDAARFPRQQRGCDGIPQTQQLQFDAISEYSPAIARRKLERIQQWNAEHHQRFLTRSSLAKFQADSVVSGASCSSNASRLSHVSMSSNLSALSISTQMTETQILAQMYSVPKSSASSSTSYAENIDPSYYCQVEMAVDELIYKMKTLIKCPEITTMKKLAGSVYSMARKCNLSHVPSNKLRAFLTDVMHLIKQSPNNDEFVLELVASIYVFSTVQYALRILVELLRAYPDELLNVFAQRLEPSFNYSNYAAIVLHTLLDYTVQFKVKLSIVLRNRLMTKVFTMVRAYRGAAESHRLREGTKHIVLDLVRLLVCGDRSAKKSFTDNGGLDLLLGFLIDEPSERVLFHAASSIRNVVDCTDYSIANRFVVIGGIKIFADKLSHGSPRLLLECSKCLCIVSDVDILSEIDLSGQLSQVLRILGASDLELVKYTLGFIGNVASNRTGNVNPNKEYLARNGASDLLMNVLQFYAPISSGSSLVSYEIIENALFALKNLTANFSTMEETCKARQKVAYHNGTLQNFLDQLSASPLHYFCKMSKEQFRIFDIQIENRRAIFSILMRLLDSDLAECILRSFSTTGRNCVEALFDVAVEVARVKAICAYPLQRKKLANISNHTIEILRRLVSHSAFNEIAANFLQ
ncbi:hypothetical protein AB6A40_002007 [Gnathostoma spinigerum]|uniref:Uncharacterized protein n=1 Tax=Gnathostoma spinigerum TaxID=75299 RepID=A0ABD6EEK5_9BILA